MMTMQSDACLSNARMECGAKKTLLGSTRPKRSRTSDNPLRRGNLGLSLTKKRIQRLVPRAMASSVRSRLQRKQLRTAGLVGLAVLLCLGFSQLASSGARSHRRLAWGTKATANDWLQAARVIASSNGKNLQRVQTEIDGNAAFKEKELKWWNPRKHSSKPRRCAALRIILFKLCGPPTKPPKHTHAEEKTEPPKKTQEQLVREARMNAVNRLIREVMDTKFETWKYNLNEITRTLNPRQKIKRLQDMRVMYQDSPKIYNNEIDRQLIRLEQNRQNDICRGPGMSCTVILF